MEARDIFAEAAFIYCMLICNKCWAEGRHTTLELEHLDGTHTYADDGWDKLLGDEARKRGWVVEDNKNFDDYLVLCPECSASRKSN